MASIEVKQISSLCKTRMRVTVSVYKTYANHCLRIYTRSAHSVLRVCMTRKQAVYAYHKNLWIRQHSASVGFIHARMNISAGLSDASTTVVFTQQKESSGKCLLCISIKQRIDNMYTQVAIHTFILSSSFSLLLDKLQFLWLSRRSLQKSTHPTGVWMLPY